MVVRELIENGRDTPVTNDNVHDYVRLLWRHHACSNDAAWHLARGLYAVLPPDLLVSSTRTSSNYYYVERRTSTSTTGKNIRSTRANIVEEAVIIPW